MFEFRIEWLHCEYTDHGPEEVRIELHLDGSDVREPYALHEEFDTGDFWEIGYRCFFDSSVEVSVYPDLEDSDDSIFTWSWEYPDSNIGTGSVSSPESVQPERWYTLSYEVDEPDETPDTELERAQRSLEDLESDPVLTIEQLEAVEEYGLPNPPSAWSSVYRSRVVEGIEEVIGPPHEPWRINQGITPLCGPKAVMIGFAWRQPRRYVEVCRSMYQMGMFLGASEPIKPSESLFDEPYRHRMSDREGELAPDRPLVPRDWITILPLRDALNTRFWQGSYSIDDPGSGVGNDQIEYIISELLGFDDTQTIEVDDDHLDVLETAGDVTSNGGIAILGIDSMLVGGTPLDEGTLWVPFTWGRSPDHAVILLSEGVDVSGDTVDFDVNLEGEKINRTVNVSVVESSLYDVNLGVPQ